MYAREGFAVRDWALRVHNVDFHIEFPGCKVSDWRRLTCWNEQDAVNEENAREKRMKAPGRRKGRMEDGGFHCGLDELVCVLMMLSNPLHGISHTMACCITLDDINKYMTISGFQRLNGHFFQELTSVN